MRDKLVLVLDNVVSVSLFIIGLTAVLAQPLVVLLYGAQWEAAVPLAYILCIAMALRCVAPTLAAALVASGRITLVMRTSLISTLLKFGFLIVTSRYGLLWGAVGFVAAEAINLVVLLTFCSRSGMFLWSNYISISVRNLPIAALGILPAAAAMLFFPVPQNMAFLMGYLALVGLASTGLWLAALWFFDRPPKSELVRLFVALKGKLR